MFRNREILLDDYEMQNDLPTEYPSSNTGLQPGGPYLSSLLQPYFTLQGYLHSSMGMAASIDIGSEEALWLLGQIKHEIGKNWETGCSLSSKEL